MSNYEDQGAIAERRTQRALFLVFGCILLLIGAVVMGVKVFGNSPAQSPSTAQISSVMARPQPTLTIDQIAMTAIAPIANATAVAPVTVQQVVPVVSITTVPRPPITLEQPASLLTGIVHGLISPFTFIMSLVTPTIRMYDPQNTGFPYDLGFLIGIVILLILINWWFRPRAHGRSRRHAA